eukprot:Sspe_Gene.34168::Locus_16621_Transcript_1_1_Confidence_1.000_Length_946::g.34168::m.34168
MMHRPSSAPRLLGAQKRMFSATTPLLKPHAMRLHKAFFFSRMQEGHRIPKLHRFDFAPSPVHGTKGAGNKPTQMHLWDYYGNKAPSTTFGERGMAVYRLMTFSRRNRQFIYTTRYHAREGLRNALYKPHWVTRSEWVAPPHLYVPPGFRPYTESPTANSREYGGWFEIPHLKKTGRIQQSEEIMTKYADDRARKMHVIRKQMAACNYNLVPRQRYESNRGNIFVGAGKSHEAGGTLSSAPPSPLSSLHNSKHGGELFSGAAGTGVYPMSGMSSS